MQNLMRPCIACGQVDDHPRHTVVIPPNQDEIRWHMDCHLMVTGCELCAAALAGADGVIGDELRAHLTRKGD